MEHPSPGAQRGGHGSCPYTERKAVIRSDDAVSAEQSDETDDVVADRLSALG